jgi:electron transport complex protein RnfC
MSAPLSSGALPTFARGGVHPDSHKWLTAAQPIVPLPPPLEIRLPLLQHIGDPSVPVVKKGDLVRRGQRVAEGQGTGVPLHASISGKVKHIDKYPHPTHVMSQAIVITRVDDPELRELDFPEQPGWRECTPDEALERIKDAGIVGLGGATFPTHRKLRLPPGVTVDTLVINGAECEPYLTSDFRLMLQRPAEVIEGSLLMARIVGAQRILVGVESDKMPAVDALRAAAAAVPPGGIPVTVKALKVRYPQGAERQIVQALTGRVIPLRKLPYAVGVVVQNVATAVAVHDAVRFRKPLLDRVITVTGQGIQYPRNLLVPLGSLISNLVAACGGLTDEATRMIAGGPMMGRALPRLDLPVVNGMNGLVFLTGSVPLDEGYGPCIHCGRCLEACPLGLEPSEVSVRVEASRALETERYGALDCYECGSCTYVCPAGRPLVQFMQVAKSSLRRASELRIVR